MTTSLSRAKEDPDWRQTNSVRDMVKNHILPRTAGTGLGYLAETFEVDGWNVLSPKSMSMFHSEVML